MLLFADTEYNGLILFTERDAAGKLVKGPDKKNIVVKADDPRQPRLASLGMICCHDDGEIVGETHLLVKPDGWVMSDEVAAINHLPQAKLEAEGIPVAEVLDAWFQMLDAKPLIVGHGLTGDLKMMRGEARRLGLPDRYDDTRNNYCTMMKSMGWVKAKNANGGMKFPTLSESYAHFFKRQFEGAHTALGDAHAVREIFLFMRKAGARS